MQRLHASKLPSPSWRRGLAILAGAAIIAAPFSAAADTAPSQTDPDAAIAALEKQIAQYQSTLANLATQKQTLQTAINSLTVSQKKVTAQISVTQAQINQASKKLSQLGGSISDKETRIKNDRAAIGAALRDERVQSDQSLVETMLSVSGPVSVWDELANLLALNASLQNDIADLSATKQSLTVDYNSTQAQQSKLVALKRQLAAQQADLKTTKAQQTALLAQTKNSEANFQKLLAAAQAELASFTAFTENAGGSKLLANQTSCDAWGCYYNQRDTQWGNMSLNGTKYRLASDGCLVTAMAMVLTHYGYQDVTPVTINSNPANFASYYPAYLLKTVTVDGVTATRVNATINSVLATGNPVIVGLHAYGGTHFVVLVSGRNGAYTMRDPYIANGKDISFNAHYSVRDIYEINKVVIGG